MRCRCVPDPRAYVCGLCVFHEWLGHAYPRRSSLFLRPGPDTQSIRPAGASPATIFFSLLLANEICGNVGKIICQTWSGSDLMTFLGFLFRFASFFFFWFVAGKCNVIG